MDDIIGFSFLTFVTFVVAFVILWPKQNISEIGRKEHYLFGLIFSLSCIACSFFVGRSVVYYYNCGYPVDFSRKSHAGEVYEIISQQQIEKEKFVVFARQEGTDDFRLFEFNTKVPEPIFVATKINGEVKPISYAPQPATTPAASAEQ